MTVWNVYSVDREESTNWLVTQMFSTESNVCA